MVGAAIGLVAGFLGGWFDRILMRLADIQLAFPSILLALAIVGFLGSGLWYVVLVLGFTGWVSYARVIRSEVLSLRTGSSSRRRAPSASPTSRSCAATCCPT